MNFIADFHIHSHFSLATSKELDPEHLDYWARIKGIGLIATGDFTHPGWIKELREKLIPAEPGLFKLKPELRIKLPFTHAETENREVRFLLSSEISNIYKKNGKVRKVHNLLYAPDFETVEKMQQELSKIGNITSDGRPILGLDSKNLLDLALHISKDIHFIPAHIWTPWFSVLGEKGGFNSVEECFEDLTEHIFAVETGLSTDPALNWMCSFLDKFTLVSNSDAHSPDRLGRNANMFNCSMDYHRIFEAMKRADGETFLGTIDLYPQEGKYHYDGHRKCNVCWNPVETLRNRAVCPVCGRRVVVGVASRIAQISDRTDISQRPNRREFKSIIPLPEILSEIYESGESSKKVKQIYFNLLQKLGSEFDILLHNDMETIESAGGPVLAEAIRRMRNGQIIIKEGFDGEYGVIKVFNPGEAKLYEAGEKLFLDTKVATVPKRKLLNFDLAEYRSLMEQHYALDGAPEEPDEQETKDWLASFNPEQKQAVMHHEGPALVLAGPGTGKTRVLTSRIACLIDHYGADPANILAVTFTNKAAGEIRERLEKSIETESVRKLTVTTFHALGLRILEENLARTGRSEGFLLAGDEERLALLHQITGKKEQECKKLAVEISLVKQNLETEEDIVVHELKAVFKKYQETLIEANTFDLDDLIYLPNLLLHFSGELKEQYTKRFQWIMIDEYQDINYGQYQLIKRLLPPTDGNLFVIGDPNQSIYGFRGSDITFIRRFTEDHPAARSYQLKKSYRCTDRILLASTQVLNLTADDTLKGTSRGLKLRIDTHTTDRAEAEFIARTIDQLMGGLQFHSMDRGLQADNDSEINSLSDFAVLCRTRAQMEVIETVFTERNIPYQMVGRESLFTREPLKTALDILSYLVSKDNILTLAVLQEKNIDLKIFSDLVADENVHDLLLQIIDRISTISGEKQEYQVQKLLDMAASFGTDVTGFLHQIRLGAGVDTWESKAERVSVMTMHASKGLEFGCVFIPGCEDGIMPYSLYFDKPDIAEEQRLLYVGMTRASKYLYLSHAIKRRMNNRELQLPRSPFLENIEQNLFEMSAREKKKEKEPDTQLKLF
ncbi:MAG TPA: UvrD-helicase domain-containing protein [Bacteroidales bacterium]